MRSRVLIAFIGFGLAGCKPDLPVDPNSVAGLKFLEVTGQWAYSATDVRLSGSPSPGPCEIAGVTLTLTKIPKAGAFSGRSTGGRLTCTGDLSFLSGPLADYAIAEGYIFNQYVAFDFGSPDWRHDGYVATADSVSVDSMSGNFKLMNGGIKFEGLFRAVRQPK